MTARLPKGGRRIDRTKPLKYTFNGKSMTGFAGDTLASALMAEGQTLLGRSFKYHRPRGVVTNGHEEPNALLTIGEGKTLDPNARATTAELFDGLKARSQNHWPSLEFDVGAINAHLSKLFPAGFYYKTFLHPRTFWKHLYEPVIRHAAGLGPAPKARDADTYEHFNFTVDVLVIGGGVAGLQAARSAAEAGANTLLLEQSAHWGGRSGVDGVEIDGAPAQAWVDQTITTLDALPNARIRSRTMAAGIYDHGYVLAYERLNDHAPETDGPRHRLWRIRAKRIVLAMGAIERPLSFANNDLPGVLLASAARDYVVDYAASPGQRTVVVTNNDDAYRTAITLKSAGLDVPAVVDARESVTGDLIEQVRDLGIHVALGTGIASVKGKGRVQSVDVCVQSGSGAVTDTFECDAVAMSGGWSPAVHLWSHTGGKLIWDDALAAFVPDPDRAPIGADGATNIAIAGLANGTFDTAAALGEAAAAGQAAAKDTGYGPKKSKPPSANTIQGTPIAPVWNMPAQATDDLRAKTWLDFQNDVKVTDVELAAREGFESVEHTKRYTTLGMATDQGKLSNINGLAVLSKALGASIPETGTTTFRPPYAPISMGSIAGEARGDLFQPVRQTPIHDWHDANGAFWEPVGHWRRPYAFPRAEETVQQAVQREVTNTRNRVGLLDASTLGKILVTGPDAGKFLDMLYTNMMSTLKSGRCRYGLMCTENGFLTDDGVVARIDETTFLCHTTSGGADRIHAHMEEWLQTEWWDWKVYTANLTENFAQIAVVGPKARDVLQDIGGMDVSAEALPFMAWADGYLGGIKARIFRISFSGELSYEIAVGANEGRAFWDALLAAGERHGVQPYGTEALHIMRAEKGFIMIGDETDGTVIPQDLGLNWAISKKKDDYLGKRAQEREHMTDPYRWRLVGLETLDGSVLPDGAYAVDTDTGGYDASREFAPGRKAGVNALGQIAMIGRVTSSYHSPTLGRGIAMGLVENGPERMGDILEFPGTDGKVYEAKIVSPVFYDPEGEKQNV
ncbi:MAG: sarcosine oxidase subunit alpha family protein [Pseudomonadota bacterium]